MLEDRVSINRVSINIEGVYSADLCEFIRKYSVWTSRFLGKYLKTSLFTGFKFTIGLFKQHQKL